MGCIINDIYALMASDCQRHAEIHLHTHLCLVGMTAVVSVFSLPIYILDTVQGSPDHPIKDSNIGIPLKIQFHYCVNISLRSENKSDEIHSKSNSGKTKKQIHLTKGHILYTAMYENL